MDGLRGMVLGLALLLAGCAKDENTKRNEFAEQVKGECSSDYDPKAMTFSPQRFSFMCGSRNVKQRDDLIKMLETSCATLKSLQIKDVTIDTFWYAQPLEGTDAYANCKFVEQNH